MSKPAAKSSRPTIDRRLPAYSTSEQTTQAMAALAAVVAREAATIIRERTEAAQDAWDALCLAIEAIVAAGVAS